MNDIIIRSKQKNMNILIRTNSKNINNKSKEKITTQNFEMKAK